MTKAAKSPKKDAGGPKRPLSAYMHFAKAKRPEILKVNPGIAFGQVGKQLGEMWRDLDAAGKAPFEKMAEADKKRYAKEKGEVE